MAKSSRVCTKDAALSCSYHAGQCWMILAVTKEAILIHCLSPIYIQKDKLINVQ